MPMTQDEYDKEMSAICSRHTTEVVYLINLNVLGAQMCHSLGHDMHLMIAESVRCYCVVHNITFEQLTACATDLDKLQGTISAMADMPDHIGQPSTAVNHLLNKFR